MLKLTVLKFQFRFYREEFYEIYGKILPKNNVKIEKKNLILI